LVEVAGIEPDTPCAETPVSIKDSEFTIEALIEILTNISGTDRQILTQLVQRWGSLSDELKEAVLRVVG
jgi:predicted transcriptional regulator